VEEREERREIEKLASTQLKNFIREIMSHILTVKS
jgi:hypothetical protein